MSTLRPPGSALFTLAQELDAGICALERALTDEIEALSGQDPGALLAAVDSKREALSRLGRLAREGHLSALVGSADPDHQSLIARLSSCRDRNAAAGSAVASARRNTEFILRVLGKAPDSPAYTSRGESRTALPNRDLGTA